MNDPHVAMLFYRIDHSEPFSYAEGAEPAEHKDPRFRIRLEDGQATVEMIEHYATAEEAQALVKPVLDAWELDAGLRRGPGVLRFRHQRSEIIDRRPTPGTVSISGSTVSVGAVFGVASVRLGAYPAPPVGLAALPWVAEMYGSFSRYKSDRKGLGITAHICLTLLQESTEVERGKGQRQAAADKYNVERCVLDTLGTLADEKGGPLHARKAKGLNAPYTDQERNWIEAKLRDLIRRAAEVAHDPKIERPKIKMDGPPKL